MRTKINGVDISIFGKAPEGLSGDLEDMITGNEHKDRLTIQKYIDDNKLYKISILYDGNTVYGKEPIIKEWKDMIRKEDVTGMSDRMYKYLSLNCGTIAHYDKRGWISVYPTIYHIASLFEENEFGRDIVSDTPGWKADVININEELLRMAREI